MLLAIAYMIIIIIVELCVIFYDVGYKKGYKDSRLDEIRKWQTKR